MALTPRNNTKTKKIFRKTYLKKFFYSVEKECPHEHDLVTLGLFILKPDPMRLSM